VETAEAEAGGGAAAELFLPPADCASAAETTRLLARTAANSIPFEPGIRFLDITLPFYIELQLPLRTGEPLREVPPVEPLPH
jgi:hypothetical protein